MKKLYLCRHAKSSWKNVRLSDFDRPLNNRGEKSVIKMGKYLRNNNTKPDYIVSSPALRAYTTAKGIAEKLNYDLSNIETNERIYGASVFDLIDIIQNFCDDYKEVMLFGHNPTITYTANELANTNIANVPTCGVATILFDLDNWSEVNMHNGDLLSFDYPKNI